MAVCIWPELVCSISSVSIHYWPESDIRVISYGRLNFPRVFMFNFMLLDILCAGIRHPSHKLWTFEFCKSLRVQFRASRNIMRQKRTSEWKIMTIWISWELPLFNFELLHISWASVIHPSQKLWLFVFGQSLCVQFRASRYIIGLNQTFESLVMAVWIFQEFSCSISCFLIYYALESDIRVNSYDHLNFLRAFVVHFRASRYIMGLNHTPKSKVMVV